MTEISSYSSNIRYQVAKSFTDELFLKWITSDESSPIINSLLEQAQKPG